MQLRHKYILNLCGDVHVFDHQISVTDLDKIGISPFLIADVQRVENLDLTDPLAYQQFSKVQQKVERQLNRLERRS